MMPQDAYGELIRRWKEASVLASCSATLEWEQHTTMPERGAEHRGGQLALLAGIVHEKMTDPAIGELLSLLETSDLVSDHVAVEAVNIREIRRTYDKSTKLPKRLVEEIARTTSIGQQEWAAARKAKDFARFKPWLSKILDLTRQKAKAIDPHAPIYDTLLDDYEAGAKADEIASTFRELRDQLVPMVSAIGQAPRQPDASILHRHFPLDRQQFFGEMVASDIGFDFTRGRLDTTTHPFCTTLGPHDVRILTRYNAHFFNESFFSVLHEAGHGLYEQGLEVEHHGTPMGEAVSLGVHESQSRLWENQVGRSEEFWRLYFGKAKGVFREALADVEVADFHFAVNKVEPSLIRVEADELTYNLHILIRFELEQALINEDLAPDGVPSAWNEKYERYLGITPPDDGVGCLQDVHWSAGLIGYFPTYSLGNMYAAQILDRAERDLGSLGDLITRGDFNALLGWLREKIHRHGKRYRPADLVKKVTGRDASAEPLIRRLREKFSPLYGL